MDNKSEARWRVISIIMLIVLAVLTYILIQQE